jgi:hypothetical protein
MKARFYRVFKVLRDDEGNIVHRTPVGSARTMQGASALVAGTSGLWETMIEPIY